MNLPHALGCPSCPHYVVVYGGRTDAALDAIATHMAREHDNPDWVASPWRLANVVVEMTEAEARQ